MNKLASIKLSTTVEEIKEILENSTIFDKIEFSGITKEQIKEKIEQLERDVPERDVLLKHSDKEITQYWFKNWLHPILKHAVQPSPADKRGCSQKVLENDMERDMLRFYENGQSNFEYTIEDVKEWLNS